MNNSRGGITRRHAEIAAMEYDGPCLRKWDSAVPLGFMPMPTITIRQIA